MGKKVVILQSNYIPWKGYFDLISSADLFIFYDDVQYTPRDWRNRNYIKTPQGKLLLTIPCGTDRNRLICDVTLTDSKWQKDHWQKISYFYKRSRYFREYSPFFEEFYLGNDWGKLSDLNQLMIRKIAEDIFHIQTEFVDSRIFRCSLRKMNRIMEILDKVGDVSEYISGPAAKDYLIENEFMKRGIQLTYMDYSGYPEYHQLYPPFIHEVSILDLIFNEGPNAHRFMKHSQLHENEKR